MKTITKTITVRLHDGDLQGMASFEEPEGGSKVVYLAPRKSAMRIANTVACSNRGVYLLLSRDRVLIGQATDLTRHLPRHMDEDPRWDDVAVVTTADDSLSVSDVARLESMFGQKASALGRLDRGGTPNASDRTEAAGGERLSDLMEWTLFLLDLRGILTFRDEPLGPSSREAATQGPHPASPIRPSAGEKLAKSTALEYVRNHGIGIGGNQDTTFAKLQPKAGCFWANPNARLLKSDWHLVLNDTQEFELVVLHVPARSLALREPGREGLLCRSDKPDYVDLSIDRDNLVDHRSGVHLSRFVIARIPY